MSRSRAAAIPLPLLLSAACSHGQDAMFELRQEGAPGQVSMAAHSDRMLADGTRICRGQDSAGRTVIRFLQPGLDLPPVCGLSLAPYGCDGWLVFGCVDLPRAYRPLETVLVGGAGAEICSSSRPVPVVTAPPYARWQPYGTSPAPGGSLYAYTRYDGHCGRCAAEPGQHCDRPTAVRIRYGPDYPAGSQSCRDIRRRAAGVVGEGRCAPSPQARGTAFGRHYPLYGGVVSGAPRQSWNTLRYAPQNIGRSHAPSGPAAPAAVRSSAGRVHSGAASGTRLGSGRSGGDRRP